MYENDESVILSELLRNLSPSPPFNQAKHRLSSRSVRGRFTQLCRKSSTAASMPVTWSKSKTDWYTSEVSEYHCLLDVPERKPSRNKEMKIFHVSPLHLLSCLWKLHDCRAKSTKLHRFEDELPPDVGRAHPHQLQHKDLPRTTWNGCFLLAGVRNVDVHRSTPQEMASQSPSKIWCRVDYTRTLVRTIWASYIQWVAKWTTSPPTDMLWPELCLRCHFHKLRKANKQQKQQQQQWEKEEPNYGNDDRDYPDVHNDDHDADYHYYDYHY